MKTLLFIGGTSFFGKLAVHKLVNTRQYRITLLTRGNSLPVEFKTGLSLIRCDRTNAQEMKAVLKGKQFDVVVDNIANNGPDVQTVLDALLGNVGHYLLCSSATVYPEWHTRHVWRETEAVLQPVPGQLSFANGKREAEKQLMESGSVPYTIYRPSIVEGPADPIGRTGYFVEHICRQKQFFIPDEVILQHVYSADVAEAILSLITAGPDNRAYNISGNDRIPIATYCDMIAEVLQQPKCYEVVSRDRWMTAEHEQFPILYDHTLLLSNAALAQRTGDQPTSIREWLPITIRWNRDHHL